MLLMRVLLVLLACLATPSLAEPASTDDAIRAFIEQVNEASTSFFVSGSEADARQKCRDLLAWAFDVPSMGKEVLGKAWDKATDEERKEYMEAFEDEVVSALSSPHATARHDLDLYRAPAAGGRRSACCEPPLNARQGGSDLDLVDAPRRAILAHRRSPARRP